jgi:hypothetical protein
VLLLDLRFSFTSAPVRFFRQTILFQAASLSGVHPAAPFWFQAARLSGCASTGARDCPVLLLQGLGHQFTQLPREQSAPVMIQSPPPAHDLFPVLVYRMIFQFPLKVRHPTGLISRTYSRSLGSFFNFELGTRLSLAALCSSCGGFLFVSIQCRPFSGLIRVGSSGVL